MNPDPRLVAEFTRRWLSRLESTDPYDAQGPLVTASEMSLWARTYDVPFHPIDFREWVPVVVRTLRKEVRR